MLSRLAAVDAVLQVDHHIKCRRGRSRSIQKRCLFAVTLAVLGVDTAISQTGATCLLLEAVPSERIASAMLV